MARHIAKPKKAKPGQVFGSNGVLYSFPKGEGGPIEIRIDFALVEAPLNYYYSNSLRLALDENQRMAVLSFGLRDENTDKFADRIDVVMPKKSLFDQFWKSSREVEDTLDKILEGMGTGSKLQPVSFPESQPTTTTLFANAIFAALGEGESTFDFYHLTPRDVHFAKTKKANIQIQPIVRVIMSSVLTKHFFETLRPYADQGQQPQPVAERSRRAARAH